MLRFILTNLAISGHQYIRPDRLPLFVLSFLVRLHESELLMFEVNASIRKGVIDFLRLLTWEFMTVMPA